MLLMFWFAFLLKNIGMDLQYLNDLGRIAPKHNLDWPQTTININKDLYNK